ncbi:MAG: hypothetical protein OEW37_10355 [Rhodospirillaceae bacterium]|nr:hypothetical protein [Rhodospirillaceae bacterium]
MADYINNTQRIPRPSIVMVLPARTLTKQAFKGVAGCLAAGFGTRHIWVNIFTNNKLGRYAQGTVNIVLGDKAKAILQHIFAQYGHDPGGTIAKIGTS